MKNLYILLLLLLFGCRVNKQNTYVAIPKEGLVNFLKYSPHFKPMISAHRGGGDIVGYPENCIESFNFIASQIPVIIECDIEITKDSILMLMHDNTLDRTTTSSGKLIETEWASMKEAKLKDNFKNLSTFNIPTLENILDWGKNKVIYTLDVKRNTPYEKVVKMVEQKKAENYCVIITYDVNQAKQIYELNPNLMISVTIRDLAEYNRYVEAGIPDKNMIAFIGTREPKKEFCDFLHQKKILTILGTLGNLDKMTIAKGDKQYKKWQNDGADVISTDRPLEAYRAISKQ